MTEDLSLSVRYTNLELPSFRYIPGEGLHPSKLAAVIHIPELPKGKEVFNAGTWANCQRYLYAIDLFNLQYYWEVHEILEKIWLKLGKQSAEGIFLQGLIQLSVAQLKKINENDSGFKRLIKKSLEKLGPQSGVFLGIDINELTRQIYDLSQQKGNKYPLIILKFE